VELYRLIKALPDDGYWKQQKLGEVQRLIEAASGLFVEATAADNQVVQGDYVRLGFFLNNRNGNTIKLNRISVNGFDTVLNAPLASNQNFTLAKPVFIPADAPLSQPYWLKNEMKEGHFEVNDQQLIGDADNAPALQAKFSLTIEGQDFDIYKPVMQKYTDPVKGEVYQPVAIVPPVVITPNRSLLLSATPEPQTTRLTVRAMKDIQRPQVKLTAARGWNTESIHYTSPDTLRKGQEMDVDVDLKPVLKDREYGKQPLLPSVEYNKESYAELLKTISYDHIPAVNYFRVPVVNMLTLDLKIAGKKIGYIEGAGDYIPIALQQMGYEVTTLNDNNLANANLGQYDAIITGVRAYNIKTSLTTYYNKLMRYVENGGNLVVQYNTSNQVGPVRAKIGPYPFDISRTRVTDEKAGVKVLKPDHPVMNYPNKITDKDFDGWIQERSIYHAGHLDPHYETIFSMHDPGESDDEGSLITAKYGKGVFVYTGLVFFRELPAGVPGAYRLLANILALNHKKGF
jgi:hypothetical protein